MGKDLNGFQQCSVLKLQLRVQRKRHYCSRFFFLISSVKKNQTEEKARSSLLWCEPDDHPFFQSIHSDKFFKSSISSNHPGAIVRHGIESIPSPRPVATTFSFSSVFFFFYDSRAQISLISQWTR